MFHVYSLNRFDAPSLCETFEYIQDAYEWVNRGFGGEGTYKIIDNEMRVYLTLTHLELPHNREEEVSC